MHTYRNLTATPAGQDRYDVVDVFTNGQVSNGRLLYTLIKSNADYIELNMQAGGMLRLHRCK